MASVKFQREPEKVALRGTEWRFQISIGGTTTEDRRVVYTAQIIMSSCDRPPARTGMRKQKAVYSEVARRLRPLGYSAAWCGSFGLF